MSNIDEKAKNNFTIEMRIFENYEKVITLDNQGKSIWYQIWIDPGDMMRIEPLLEGGKKLGAVKTGFVFRVPLNTKA